MLFSDLSSGLIGEQNLILTLAYLRSCAKTYFVLIQATVATTDVTQDQQNLKLSQAPPKKWQKPDYGQEGVIVRQSFWDSHIPAGEDSDWLSALELRGWGGHKGPGSQIWHETHVLEMLRRNTSKGQTSPKVHGVA